MSRVTVRAHVRQCRLCRFAFPAQLMVAQPATCGAAAVRGESTGCGGGDGQSRAGAGRPGMEHAGDRTPAAPAGEHQIRTRRAFDLDDTFKFSTASACIVPSKQFAVHVLCARRTNAGIKEWPTEQFFSRTLTPALGTREPLPCYRKRKRKRKGRPSGSLYGTGRLPTRRTERKWSRRGKGRRSSKRRQHSSKSAWRRGPRLNRSSWTRGWPRWGTSREAMAGAEAAEGLDAGPSARDCQRRTRCACRKEASTAEETRMEARTRPHRGPVGRERGRSTRRTRNRPRGRVSPSQYRSQCFAKACTGDASGDCDTTEGVWGLGFTGWILHRMATGDRHQAGPQHQPTTAPRLVRRLGPFLGRGPPPASCHQAGAHKYPAAVQPWTELGDHHRPGKWPKDAPDPNTPAGRRRRQRFAPSGSAEGRAHVTVVQIWTPWEQAEDLVLSATVAWAFPPHPVAPLLAANHSGRFRTRWLGCNSESCSPQRERLGSRVDSEGPLLMQVLIRRPQLQCCKPG